jgi:hypothetical protein
MAAQGPPSFRRKNETMTTYESASGSAGARSDVATERRDWRRTFTEAKSGFKTSEFYLTVIGVVGVIIAALVDDNDSLTVEDGFRFASWILAAYIVSRGLAKLGTREPYVTDHDR